MFRRLMAYFAAYVVKISIIKTKNKKTAEGASARFRG